MGCHLADNAARQRYGFPPGAARRGCCTLAARPGGSPKTICFYEDKGLLPRPARRVSGYRGYGPEDEGCLIFVKTARRLGLTMA